MPDFRWGIIGAGRIAHKFAEAVCGTEGMNLSAVAARSADDAKTFADKYGCTNAVGGYENVSAADVDAVYIATVNSHHFAPIMMMLDKGIPVLCEKPMLMSVAEFDAASKKAREHNLLLTEAMWTSFLPAIKKTKELILSGKIGTVHLAKSDFCVQFLPDNIRIFQPELGGGVIFDIGVYCLHSILNIFGTKFSALKCGGSFGNTNVNMDAVISFKYKSGPLVNITTSGYVTAPRLLGLYGDKGSIEVDDFMDAQSIRVNVYGEPLETFSFPHDNGFWYEIISFAETVRSGEIDNDIVPVAVSRSVCELMEKVNNTLMREE